MCIEGYIKIDKGINYCHVLTFRVDPVFLIARKIKRLARDEFFSLASKNSVKI